MPRYIAMQPLVPGRRVDVLEKNEHNHTIGAYYGYWNYKTQTVALYPNVRNRYVNWPDGKIPDKKKYVSDRDVAVRRADGTTSSFRSSQRSSAPAAQESSEMVAPAVQERMKF